MAKEPIKLTPLGDILRANYPDFDNWLVKGLVPLEGLTIISGQPGHMKSFIAQHLALCVATGRPFLGQYEVPNIRKVLYFYKEGRKRTIKDRFSAFGANGDPLIEITEQQDFYLDCEEDVDLLVSLLKENKEYIVTGLVILDSFIRYHHGEENSSTSMSKVLENAKRIASVGPAVVLIHHHGKERFGSEPSPNSLRGSSDIYAVLDSHIAVTHDREQDVLSFTHHKIREAALLDPFAARVIRRNDDKKDLPIGFECIGSYDKDHLKLEVIKDSVISIFQEDNDERSRGDVYEAIGSDCSKALINRTLDMLVDERYLSRRTGKSNKRFYSRIKQEGETADISVDKVLESSL